MSGLFHAGDAWPPSNKQCNGGSVALSLLFLSEAGNTPLITDDSDREGADVGDQPPPQEVLLTPSEVAALFRVDPKTVTRWAKAGKLTSIRTLGGHRRYKESEVKALLNKITAD